MKVKDLKEMLKGVDDDMEVLIPMTGEFDGCFKYPCLEESGVSEMGIDDSDEVKESFILLPCGFFNEPHGVPAELN